MAEKIPWSNFSSKIPIIFVDFFKKYSFFVWKIASKKFVNFCANCELLQTPIFGTKLQTFELELSSQPSLVETHIWQFV